MRQSIKNTLKVILVLPAALTGYVVTATVGYFFACFIVFIGSFYSNSFTLNDYYEFVMSDGFGKLGYFHGTVCLFWLRFGPAFAFFLTPTIIFPNNKKLVFGLFAGLYFISVFIGGYVIFIKGNGINYGTEHLIRLVLEFVFISLAIVLVYRLIIKEDEPQ